MEGQLEQNCNQYGAHNLPYEIALQIFAYLDGSDLLACQEVSATWRHIASDGFLWQTKLCELCGKRWSVISCDQKPQNPLNLSDLQAVHPCEIYRFLVKFIPSNTYGAKETPISKNISRTNPDESTRRPRTRGSLGEQILHWWNQVIRRLSLSIGRRPSRSTTQRYRFAVFGPGFDQRATSRLFSKLVDARTKSFEPINMIPGRMGFGAGLTLKLYAQAQQAVFDPSLEVSDSQQSLLLRNRSDRRTAECIPQRPGENGAICTTNGEGVAINNVSSPRANSMFCDDFVFDLHYLYSLRGHLSHNFNTQLERLLRSRLFRHPSGDDRTSDAEVIQNLEVTESMHNILHGLNGILYALDARETVEQTRYLYHELRAVLRGLPGNIATRVPIAVLYIMPKEDIDLKPFTPQVQVRADDEGNTGALQNRDSYSGSQYTVSWRGSILLPISCLDLFELHNPWRLQKCASNDIRAVIQSIMWLRARAPVIPAENFYALTRSNSTL
ncbi:unnamed protein product [Dicrocoelium dendriticum]|nr:unnamed protein product [Dicrocoelium dendriticum]